MTYYPTNVSNNQWQIMSKFLDLERSRKYDLREIVNAVLIAVVAWVVTNLIIIPLSKIPNHPFSFSKALIALIILIFSIGLPISYFAKKFYGRQKNVSM